MPFEAQDKPVLPVFAKASEIDGLALLTLISNF
jgi:hypothetical protein